MCGWPAPFTKASHIPQGSPTQLPTNRPKHHSNSREIPLLPFDHIAAVHPTNVNKVESSFTESELQRIRLCNALHSSLYETQILYCKLDVKILVWPISGTLSVWLLALTDFPVRELTQRGFVILPGTNLTSCSCSWLTLYPT